MTSTLATTPPDNPAADRAPRRATVAILVAILCAIWGSTWLVIREGLRDLPPLLSAGARFLVAFVVVAAIAPALSRREGGDRPPAWLWLTTGGANFAVSYAIVYRTETVLPSGIVAVLWAVFPLMMAALGHVALPGERLLRRHATGFLLGFAGVALLFATDLRTFGSDAIPAALLLFVSPLVSAIGTVLIKRHGGAASAILLNRNAFAVAAGVLLAGALLFERDARATWTGPAILSVLYLGVVGTGATFTLYFWLMRYTRANRLALIAFVTPCIALVLGSAVGDEPLTGYTIGGTLLVVLGVRLVVTR